METRQRSALLVKNEIIFPMFGYAQIIISGLMGYIDDPIAGSSSETELVLRRIPLLGWDKFADLFRPEESLPAVSIPTTLSSSKIRTIENSRRSAQQPKFHSLPMTTIFWRIEN